MTDSDEDRVRQHAGNDCSPAALETFVASVQHLPLFSGTAVQLIRSVDEEQITAGELSRLIATDVALSAHLLRIVNSPYYGLARRIGTVSDALTVLGFNLVRRTVTAIVLQRPLFAYLHDTQVARAFWRHELMCAALARHLALRKGFDGEFAYMAGLLHDVGRLAMLMQFPDHTDMLLQQRSDDDDAGIARERERFGFDHAQVGGALLELWGLPGGMVQAAHQHADETEPEDPRAADIWRANLISHEMAEDAEPTSGVDPNQASAWMSAIDMSVKARKQILDEIAALENDRG
jgi:putative nucleotidyltransferase with HDIG domain